MSRCIICDFSSHPELQNEAAPYVIRSPINTIKWNSKHRGYICNSCDDTLKHYPAVFKDYTYDNFSIYRTDEDEQLGSDAPAVSMREE